MTTSQVGSGGPQLRASASGNPRARRSGRLIGSLVVACSIALAVGCGDRGDGASGAGASGANADAYRIGLLYFAPEASIDVLFEGLFAGLKQQGLEEGRNLVVERAHAQAEIANIPLLVQNFDQSGLDLIVALTTPCLAAAAAMARNTPVVFTYVFDPIAAGAGTSFTDHLPHVTGIGSFPPVEDNVALIRRVLPSAKKVGTVYNSSEANSRKVMEVARPLFEQRGMSLEEVTVTGTADIYLSAQAVVSRGLDALWITGDNTVYQGFDSVVKVARDARLPLFIDDPVLVERGALAAVGVGWYEAGRAAAPVIKRVLEGESPARIPFENVAVKKIVLNDEVARTLRITFPTDLVEEVAAAAAAAPR